MKKAVALLMATIMVFTVGCGSAPAASSQPQPSQQSSTQSSSVPQKEITINFPCIWVGTDSKAEVFGQMVEAYNTKNSGKVKVVIEESTDYQAYRDKVRTSITAGTAPDIFTFDNLTDLNTYSQSGKLMDLTKYLEADWGKTFADGSIAAAKVGGANFAIPYEQAIMPPIYNSRLFEKVGITDYPKTYDELWVAFDKLKAAGITPIGQMTGENAWTSMLWYSQILVAIGGPDIYSRGLDDPAFVEAAKVIKKMYEYTTSDAVGAGAAVVNGHVFNERIAVYTNGPWFVGRFAKEGVEGLGDVMQVANAPAYTGGKGTYGGLVGVTQAYIAAGKQTDPDKEAAVIDFLQYITNPQDVAKLATKSGSMFYIKTEPSADANRLQAQMIEVSNKAPYTVPHFQGAMPTAVANEFPQALSSLVLGESTPEQFVEMLKAAANK